MARNITDEEQAEIAAFSVEEPLPLRPQYWQAGGYLPLLSNAEVDEWREKADERAKRREQARLEMREREAKITAYQAMADAYAQGFSPLQEDILGAAMAAERKLWRTEIAALKVEIAELKSAPAD